MAQYGKSDYWGRIFTASLITWHGNRPRMLWICDEDRRWVEHVSGLWIFDRPREDEFWRCRRIISKPHALSYHLIRYFFLKRVARLKRSGWAKLMPPDEMPSLSASSNSRPWAAETHCYKVKVVTLCLLSDLEHSGELRFRNGLQDLWRFSYGEAFNYLNYKRLCI